MADNTNDKKENLELSKVLAASLAYTQKEFRRAKRELIEDFKEILDPDTGELGLDVPVGRFILLPPISNVVPSKVKFDSAFEVAPPVAVMILLFALLDTETDPVGPVGPVGPVAP